MKTRTRREGEKDGTVNGGGMDDYNLSHPPSCPSEWEEEEMDYHSPLTTQDGPKQGASGEEAPLPQTPPCLPQPVGPVKMETASNEASNGTSQTGLPAVPEP